MKKTINLSIYIHGEKILIYHMDYCKKYCVPTLPHIVKCKGNGYEDADDPLHGSNPPSRELYIRWLQVTHVQNIASGTLSDGHFL